MCGLLNMLFYRRLKLSTSVLLVVKLVLHLLSLQRSVSILFQAVAIFIDAVFRSSWSCKILCCLSLYQLNNFFLSIVTKEDWWRYRQSFFRLEGFESYCSINCSKPSSSSRHCSFSFFIGHQSIKGLVCLHHY